MGSTIWVIWLFLILPDGQPKVWQEAFGERGACLDRRIELLDADAPQIGGRRLQLVFTDCIENTR